MKKNILMAKQYFECVKTRQQKIIATFFMLLGTGISSSNTLCTDILSASQKGVMPTLDYFCNLYRVWWPFILIISIIVYCLLSPNSKSKPIAKWIAIGSCFAYAATLGYNIITGTVDIIIFKFGISGVSNI